MNPVFDESLLEGTRRTRRAKEYDAQHAQKRKILGGITGTECLIILAIIFISLGMLAGCSGSVLELLYVGQDTITVIEKEAVGGRNSTHYIIFTKDAEFIISECLWERRFNTSGLYKQVNVGETYGVKYRGVRIPFLNLYPNILNLRPIEEESDDGTK